MIGDQYLADTNTFIALLNKNLSIHPFLDSDWCFSFITEIELLGKMGIKPDEVKEIKNLLHICSKLSHTEIVSQLTISLRQQHKIKVPCVNCRNGHSHLIKDFKN
jgi:hypothetical protein